MIYNIGAGMYYFEPETDPEKIKESEIRLEVMLNDLRSANGPETGPNRR
jgi:hypothetical protein